MTDQEQYYSNILEPAIKAVIAHFITNEQKYGVGLHLSDKDIQKALTHAQSAVNGEHNPDGVTHAVATASRALKAVLLEQMNGD